MSFLTPLALIGGLLAIPILLLYMLRLRRREIPVSSTYLWQQLLLDREANTPWQRLRRNLLLLLQLLILALLVLALARPYIVVPAVSAGQTALLLDASASMNATDSPEGTRFEAARRQALEMVETMSAGDRMTVIRVAAVPEVLVPYTNDRTLLRDAINSAQPSLASADWAAALTLAGDAAKGWFAVWLAQHFAGDLGLTSRAIALVAVAAFLGHLYPLFLRFAGGKGVATALGVLLALEPALGLAAAATWLIVAVFFRYSSLASIVSAIFVPVYYLFGAGIAWHTSAPIGVAIGAISLLLIYRHRANIARLAQGTESRIGGGKKKS